MPKLRTKEKYSFLIPWLYTKIEKFCTFDIETTGFNPRTKKIFAYCIGHWDGSVDVYRLDHEDKKLNKRNWQILLNFFADTSIAKIAHNYKFELSFLKSHGVPIPAETVWHDTMIMSQLLRNLGVSHALDYLGWELFGYPRTLDSKVKKLGKLYGTYQKIDKDLFTEYQIADGIRPMVLFRIWYDEIKNDILLWKDYINEIELIKVTEKMEGFGLQVDIPNAIKLLKWVEKQYEDVMQESMDYLGEFINLNSDKKLSNYLYSIRGFPVLKRTKTGNPSTDKDTLFGLRELYPSDDIFDLIIKWRSYATGKTTVNNYIQLADENDIIHSRFNTNKAKTGRQSSEDPNLNNVAKESVKKNLYPIPSRKCFGARFGRILYLVDYSGIEMRLIINESGEPVMMDLLKNGQDPHLYASELFFGKMFTDRDYCLRNYLPENKNMLKAYRKDLKLCNNDKERDNVKNEYFTKCRKVLRDSAKNGQFALAYGAGLKKIGETLSLDVDFLKPGFDAYCKACPKIANFTRDIAHIAKREGCVKTVFGRSLYITQDKLWSAGNYLIQGTAAGILKRAEVKLNNYFEEEWSDKIKLLIPIHDELIMSNSRTIDLQHRNKIMYECSERMIDMPEIEIPLDVEWKISTTTWNRAEKYDFRKANKLLHKYSKAA